MTVTYCTEANPPASMIAAGNGWCRKLDGHFGGTPFVGASMNDRISYVKID
jgi:hypothetical protein